MTATRSALLGGFVAGLLDILYACIVFGLRSQVSPMRIGQAIASHVLGQASFDGGWGSAILGFGLHFFIAIAMAFGLLVICRAVPFVARHVVTLSPIYGLVLYAVMTYAVLPLTDPNHGPYPTFPPAIGFSLYSALFAHIVLVTLPIAFFLSSRVKEA